MFNQILWARLGVVLILSLCCTLPSLSIDKVNIAKPSTSPPFVVFNKNSTNYNGVNDTIIVRNFCSAYKSLKSDKLRILMSYYICDSEIKFDKMLAYKRAEKIISYGKKYYDIERITFLIRDNGENTITGRGCADSGIMLSIVR